ncbi:MAG TPA: DUF3352 domain-containing protein [Pyrinomonadaceae bacterium]|nr:DUF3352 domain-containing protein [Pyrinomonadaceae bacterium]
MNRLKRKPYVFGAAAAALVLGLAALQLARPSRAESPRLERFLPADTVGFVEVNDLRAQAVRVIESEAWREFSKENQAASSLFMMAANHAGALDASYALALVGAGADGPRFVVVAEFNGGGARRTFENRVLRTLREASAEGVTTKTEQHGDVTVNTVTPAGGKGFSYAKDGDTLFLSNSADALRGVLDVRAGKSPSLETNETFAQARARAKYSDGMFGYLDGAALARLADSAPAAAAEPRHGLEAFRQLFRGAGADGVQSVAFTSGFEDGRVAERFVVVAPERRGLLGTVASNPPTPQALLALVPEDAVQVFDASIANAPQTFEEVLALVSQAAAQAGKQGHDMLAEFAAKTGVSLREDIVGSLGGEVCFAQLPAGGGRAGVLILAVRDERAFAAALEKFAAHTKRAVGSREHRGVTVSSLTDGRGRSTEYAFVGGNFVMSEEAGGVERVIETAQGGPSLRAAAAYREASAVAAGQPQFVYFNTNADYLNRLGRMLKSGEQEFKTEGQRAALRPSFAYGVAQPDGFYVESRTPLGTFPRLLTAITSKLGAEPEQAGRGR